MSLKEQCPIKCCNMDCTDRDYTKCDFYNKLISEKNSKPKNNHRWDLF